MPPGVGMAAVIFILFHESNRMKKILLIAIATLILSTLNRTAFAIENATEDGKAAILCLGASPDGKFVAIGIAGPGEERSLGVVDWKTRRSTFFEAPKQSIFWLDRVSWSPDSKYLAFILVENAAKISRDNLAQYINDLV